MRYDEPLLVFQVLCFVVLVSTVDFFFLRKSLEQQIVLITVSLGLNYQ